MIKFVDMFSGIGGFREGLTRAGGFECVGHCEIDKYANRSYNALFDTKGEWFIEDGSNLNFEQMAYRCPEATVVGTAKLDGYELAFRRGYLTILPKEGASVEGLIWSVTDHDESQLDCYEGYPTFYDKETMTVTDADGTPHEIMVYTMNAPYRDQLLPVSSRYNAVVMQGCLDAGISPQQFYDADEKYRKAYKARAAPVPKKHAPER